MLLKLRNILGHPEKNIHILPKIIALSLQNNSGHYDKIYIPPPFALQNLFDDGKNLHV
jgi:hypothetical protein